MPIRITMPRLSDTMEEGTLIKWNVKVGDKVEAGDVLAEVETDKATMELPSFEDGTVARLAVDEGQTLPVGKLIAVLAEDGEDVKAAASASTDDDGDDTDKPAAKADKADAKDKSADDDGEEASEESTDETSGKASGGSGETSGGGGSGGSGETSGGRIKVSPVARKIAEEHDLDLADIDGSGPDGRIIKRDVQALVEGKSSKAGKADKSAADKTAAAAAPVSATKLESKKIPVNNMRKTIAKRLVESKTQVPHFQVSVDVSMDALLTLREQINAQLSSQGVKLSVNDFVVRATALACIQHPVVNSSWAGDHIAQHGSVNVGVAIALPTEKGGGLVVATVRDVQNKGLRQINTEVKQLADKARGKGLSTDEMTSSTITISNLGMPQYAVSQFTAIINPPNAAILAVAATMQKPVVRDGQLAVGHVMNITLSGDHRVIDGAGAAEYLKTLRELLEAPAAILV